MLQKALESIREAEAQAASMVVEARRKAAALRDETAREIRQMDEEATREISQARQSMTSDAEEKGKGRAEELLATTQKQVDLLRKEAASRTDAAVAQIRERLTG